MAEKIDFGWVEEENNGNTTIFNHYFHYDNASEKSLNPPSYEGSAWGSDNFYMISEGKKIELQTPVLYNFIDTARHAEKIGDSIYVITGEKNYPDPCKENLEECYGAELYQIRGDVELDDFSHQVFKVDNIFENPTHDFLESPSGRGGWTYNELKNSDFIRKIVYPGNNSSSNTSDSNNTSVNKPSKFKIKAIDKITNFNPSIDTLEIDTDSFGIDSSATFAAGKNKKTVKKKLAKQDFDFLYDEKKGGLYFNENGSDKGFGNGGIVAILKGAPDLTSDNLEFI